MNKECECNCKPTKCCPDECCKSPENECKCKNKVVNYWQDEELKPKRENKTIMNRKEIELTYQDIPLLFADGFDKAIVGVSQQFNSLSVAYDKRKCIEILKKDMSEDEAMEYFDFNIVGAYVGEHTPSFIER